MCLCVGVCWCVYVCMYWCMCVCLCICESRWGQLSKKPGYYYYSLKSEMCLNCILCFVLPMFNLLFQNRIFVNWLHWDRIKFVIIKIKLLFNEEYVLGHFIPYESRSLTTCVVIGGVVGV